jgi:3-deoxy-7-phosphoheptulonate synthase
MPDRATFAVAGQVLDRASLLVIAGPCSLTEHDKTLRVARAMAAAGASMFRGGIYKPRSDPHAFQGVGARGLAMLAAARAETGLPVVTEVLDTRDVEQVAAVADVLQVGARNMHNTALLKELGRTDRPVLLKRGLSATVDELIKASSYITEGGNPRVLLCERGVRTFETAYRFTLDLLAVPVLQERSGLPVIVDPSHAPGRRDLVLAMSKAAIAAGSDGLIVEIDEDPDQALSDPAQQLAVPTAKRYMSEIARVAIGEGRRVLRF